MNPRVEINLNIFESSILEYLLSSEQLGPKICVHNIWVFQSDILSSLNFSWLSNKLRVFERLVKKLFYFGTKMIKIPLNTRLFQLVVTQQLASVTRAVMCEKGSVKDISTLWRYNERVSREWVSALELSF